MKKFLLTFSNGLIFGLGILCILIMAYFGVKARSGLTASPGDKLTATNWNNLVNKVNTATDYSFTGAGLKTFFCERTFSCATSGRGSEYTRQASDCGGTYKPSDFTNCFYAVRKFGGSNSSSAFHAIRPASKNSINVWCSQPSFVISMNYLCRN